MRKVYERVELVKSPIDDSNDFADDLEVAIKSLQLEGYEVEVQTQNITGQFAVLLLAYEMKAGYTDY